MLKLARQTFILILGAKDKVGTTQTSWTESKSFQEENLGAITRREVNYLETVGSHFTSEFLLPRVHINFRQKQISLRTISLSVLAPIAACSHRILAFYAVSLMYFLASPGGVPHRFTDGSLSTRNNAPDSPEHERLSAPVRNECEINKIKLNKLVILITSRTRASSVCVHATLFVTGKEHIYKCYEKKKSPFTYK